MLREVPLGLGIWHFASLVHHCAPWFRQEFPVSWHYEDEENNANSLFCVKSQKKVYMEEGSQEALQRPYRPFVEVNAGDTPAPR